MSAIRELDPLDARRPRPGELAGGPSLIAWAGAFATLLICLVGPRLLANQGDDRVLESMWFRDALGIGVIGLLALAALPASRLASTLRIAAALPFVHLGVLGLAWAGWLALAPKLVGAVGMTPLVDAVPLGAVLAIVVAGTVLGGIAVARRRRREVAHAMVMIALVQLLLLGVWLPVVANAVAGTRYLDAWTVELSAVATPGIVATVLVPPFVLAVVYTALALRRARIVIEHRTGLLGVLVVMWVGALMMRANARELSLVLYANYLPWLFAGAVAAAVAIAALAVATLRTSRGLRSAQHVGTIAAMPDETVAGYAITSWLRGPEPIATGFDVITADGAVPVPGSAHLVAPVPLASTALRVGELVPVLRTGDPVAVAGYEQHATGQPFRDTRALVPGTGGIAIAPYGGGARPFEQLALAAWRPAVAYLVVLLAVAAPALAALADAR